MITIPKIYGKPIIQMGVLVAALAAGVTLVGIKTNILGLAAGSTATLALPETKVVENGTQFSVPITLTAKDMAVNGVDVQLKFDPNQLRLAQVEPVANTTSTLMTFTPIDSSNKFNAAQVVSDANTSGIIRFSALTFNSQTMMINPAFKPIADTVLANLVFVPLKSGVSNVAFDYKAGATNDSNVVLEEDPVSDVLAGVTDMVVTVTYPPATPTPVNSNLIINPGFESGTMTGWQNKKATLNNNPDDVHGGTNAVTLTGNGAIVYQSLENKLKTGTEYTFSVWVKVTKKGTSWGVPTLRISRYKDLGSADFGESKAENNTGDWQQLIIKRQFTTQDLAGPVFLGLVNFGYNGTDVADDFGSGINSGTAEITATPIPIPSATIEPTAAPSPTPVPPTATPTPRPSPTPTTPPPTPTPTASAATPASISVNGQMGNQDGSNYSTSSVWIGTTGNTSSSYLALRFPGLSIPKGATITSAVISLQSAANQWISVAGVMSADNSGDSAVFSGSALPSARAVTGSVNHSENTNWLNSNWYNLESVSSLVQSIVSRNDWVSGNNLSIIIKGSGSAWGRKFISAAKLTVSYK